MKLGTSLLLIALHIQSAFGVGKTFREDLEGIKAQQPSTNQNLFIEEQIPLSNNTNALPGVGRFLVSGTSSMLFDATKKGIEVTPLPSCSSPTATVRLQCPADNPECSELQNPGLIILLPCQKGSGTSGRIMRVGNIVMTETAELELDTKFDSAGVNGEPIAMSLDYSNSADFFSEAGLAGTREQDDLLRLISSPANGVFSNVRDKIKRWVDKVRTIDIDQATPIDVPIGPFSQTVINETLGVGRCSSTAVAAAAASIQAEIKASANALGIFGIKVVGTVVPFNIKEAYAYVRLSGSAEIKGVLDISLVADLSRDFRAPPVDIPIFGVEGLIAVGPQFNLKLRAAAQFKALGSISTSAKIVLPEHDVYVGIAGDQTESDSMKSKSPNQRPSLTEEVKNGLYIDGKMSFDVIPSFDIGIDALAGAYKATVGVQAVGDVTLQSQFTSSGLSSQSCISGTARASIAAVGSLNSKDITGLGGIAFSSDPFELFKSCRNNTQSDMGDQAPPTATSAPQPKPTLVGEFPIGENRSIIAFKRSVRQNLIRRQSDPLKCIDFGFDIVADSPFSQSYSQLRTVGYELFDSCIFEGNIQRTCPSLSSFSNEQVKARAGERSRYRLVGFHGTSKKAAASITATGPKSDLKVRDSRDERQYGPGFYVTDHVATAREFAMAAAKRDDSDPVLLDVFAENFESMKAHIFPKAAGLIWFGSEPWLAAKSQRLLDEYDYIGGPHLSTAGEAVQIKFNPKSLGKLLVTIRPDAAPLPPSFSRPLRRVRRVR